MKEEAPAYEEIYKRVIGVCTEIAVSAIRSSCVAIAGVGGTGSQTAVALARMGIGKLVIADPETFDASNMNRQYGAVSSTLGKNKALVMEEILKDVNPHLEVKAYYEGINSANIDEFLNNADVAVDGVDYAGVEAKVELFSKAREKGLYVVSGPISGWGATIMCFAPDGMAMEEAFAMPADKSQYKLHKIPPRRLLGCTLEYLPELFFERLTRENDRYVPSIGPAAILSGIAATAEVVKLVLKKKVPEFADLEIITMPFAKRYDLFDISKNKIVNIMENGK
ncbi:MAG: ThiF family adenylyltransferase [Nanoarchaeota archaeon]|nr:ThiF family adenylyltransferase [Nanoarchaeota archaeon]